MRKRLLALFLILTFITSYIPVSIAGTADLYNPTFKAAYSNFDSFNDYAMYVLGLTEPFIVHPQTREQLSPNKATYDKYGIIVFGSPSDVDYADLESGKPHENVEATEWYDGEPLDYQGYRYLGYSQNGDVVTNMYYPPDATSDPDTWISRFSTIDDAPQSWGLASGNIEEYMTKKWIYGNGVNTGSDINTQYTVETINNTTTMADLNSYPIDGVSGTYSKTKLLTVGGWYAKFSVRTERDSNRWYQTWFGDEMAEDATITQHIYIEDQNNDNVFYTDSDVTYTMASDQEFINVKAKYYSKINANAYMKLSDLASYTMTLQIQTTDSKTLEVDNAWSKTIGNQVKVERGSLQVGRNELFVRGTYNFETIYGSDPPQSGQAEQKLIVIVEEPEEPSATCLVTADPNLKESEGGTESVDVTVDVTTYKITNDNIVNIAVWLDGERLYAPVDNPTVTFNKTVDCSAIDDDNTATVTKTWNATVNINLKGGRQIQCKGDDYTKFIGSGIDEEAVVRMRAPSTVYAGDIETVSAYGSSDYPLSYLIINDETDDVFSTFDTDTKLNLSGQYEFKVNPININEEYTQTFTAITSDKNGAVHAEDETKVLPPKPVAKIHTEGVLKPYRKFTISSTQTKSPDKYPLDVNETDWTLTSGTIAIGTDTIATPSDPDGSEKFDMGVRKTGTFDASVYVKNTLGLYDSTSETITISEDEPPIADMALVNKIFRDPTNANKATVNITSLCSSPDGDDIGAVTIHYWYDSDNDGRFNDESPVLADSFNVQTLSDSDPYPQIAVQLEKTGRYYFRIACKETYDVMPGMESEAVFLTANSHNGVYNDKYIVEVDNIAPSVGGVIKEPKSINLVLQTGNSGINTSVLDNYINGSLSVELASQNISIDSYEIIDEAVGYEFSGQSQSLYGTAILSASATLGYKSAYNNKVYTTVGDNYDEFKMGSIVSNLDSGASKLPSHAFPSGMFEYYGVTINSVSDMVAYTSDLYAYPSSLYAVTTYNDYINNTENASIYFVQNYWFYDGSRNYVAACLVEITPNFAIKRYKIHDFIATTGGALRTSIYALISKPNTLFLYGYDGYFEFDTETSTFTSVSSAPSSSERVGNTSLWSSENDLNYSYYTDGYYWTTEDPEDRYTYYYFDYDHSLAPHFIGALLTGEGSWSGTHPRLQQFDFIERLEDNFFYTWHQYQTLGVYSYITQRKDYFYTNFKNHLEDAEDNTYYVLLGNDDFSYITSNEQGKINTLIANKPTITTNTSGKLSSANHMDTYTDLGQTILDVENENNATSDTIICEINDSILMSSLYFDYEADAKKDEKADVVHTDMYYYDNPMTLSVLNNTEQRVDELTFDSVGLYDVDVLVRDQTDLDAYSYWSDNSLHAKVYVHRKPIADFNYDPVRGDFENLSKDLDHQFSDANKGISESVIQYRYNDFGEWEDGLPTLGTAGADGYVRVRLKVKDLEGAWSDWVEKKFYVYASFRPFTITAELEAVLSPLAAFTPNNYVRWGGADGETYIFVNDWQRFAPVAHHLEVSLYKDGAKVDSVPTQYYYSDEYLNNGGYYNWYWNDIDFYIPDFEGLESGTYQVEIAAVANDSETKV